MHGDPGALIRIPSVLKLAKHVLLILQFTNEGIFILQDITMSFPLREEECLWKEEAHSVFDRWNMEASWKQASWQINVK